MEARAVIRKNIIFASMGATGSAGLVPFKEEPERNFDVVELLWHPREIALHESGHRPHIGNVICDPSRDKRKLWNFAEAWNAGLIPRDRDAYLIADDDLTPIHGWSAVFDLFHESKLAVAQAALTHDSTKAWPITIQEADVLWRHSDFVECMMPIVRGDLIARMIPHFLQERNGWGIEAFFANCFSPIGILDATPVIHARPVGSADALGHWSRADAEQLAEEYRRQHHLAPQTRLWPGHTLKRVIRRPAESRLTP